MCVFFLMYRRPPRSTRTDTLLPYTTLFRSRSLTWVSGASDFRGRPRRAGVEGDISQTLPTPSAWSAHAAFGARPRQVINHASFIFRSEEHTSELQSLMRISYAVFCLKKKRHIITHTNKLNNPINNRKN